MHSPSSACSFQLPFSERYSAGSLWKIWTPSISRITLPKTPRWVSCEESNTARRPTIPCSCVYAGENPRRLSLESVPVDLVLLLCIAWMSRVIRRVLAMNLECALPRASSPIRGMRWCSMVNGDSFNAIGEQGLCNGLRERENKRRDWSTNLDTWWWAKIRNKSSLRLRNQRERKSNIRWLNSTQSSKAHSDAWDYFSTMNIISYRIRKISSWNSFHTNQNGNCLNLPSPCKTSNNCPLFARYFSTTISPSSINNMPLSRRIIEELVISNYGCLIRWNIGWHFTFICASLTSRQTPTGKRKTPLIFKVSNSSVTSSIPFKMISFHSIFTYHKMAIISSNSLHRLW